MWITCYCISCGKAAQSSLFDPVTEILGKAELVSDFWKKVSTLFGYTAGEPNLIDFAVHLFQGSKPP